MSLGGLDAKRQPLSPWAIFFSTWELEELLKTKIITTFSGYKNVSRDSSEMLLIVVLTF